MDIISGAGHDACWINRVAPTAMVMCPCVDGCRTTRPRKSPRNGRKRRHDVLFHAVVETAEIVDQGFTAIEPDGFDAYAEDSGFPLTAADTVRYATTLAHVAHGLGLRIAQKNVPELTEALMPHFDFAITESCFETGTCEQIAAYPKANKPAFNAEYTDADIDFAKACAEGARLNINMIRKDRPVTAPVIFCQAEF
jgi:hypothetical protein